MPEKSVREMGKWQRVHHSLSATVFRTLVKGTVILALIALLIGLGLYSFALTSQNISEAFHIANTVALALEPMADTEQMALDTMMIYRSLTPAERSQTGTEDYRARFASVSEREDYRAAQELLGEIVRDSEVYDIYVAMYDRDTSAVVYIIDPEGDPALFCAPGDWDRVRAKEVRTFLSWDGEGIPYAVNRTAKYGWLGTAGVPIKNEEGLTVAFLLVDISMEQVAQSLKSVLLEYIVALAIAVVVVGFFLTRHMRKTLVKPINAITEAAEAYVKDKRAGISGTEHFASLNIRTGDEVENLSLVMADMEKDLSDFEDSLAAVTAENERIGTELAVATRIQSNVVPNIFPPFPDRSEVDIYASMLPAKEVGGDFYDFFLIDDDHLGLVMADVSGKGVPAALFMMASKILVQNYTLTGRSPKQVLEAVNTQLCENNYEEMFVTVWLGVLNLATGRLTAANAGHEYPVLKKPDGSFELIRDKHGLVIGGMITSRYKEYEIQMEPGAKLFLYTDGITEATDANNVLFGTDRMIEALRRGENGEPRDVLCAVDEALRNFVGEAPQFDDITMLCVQYNGRNGEGGASVKELTVPAEVENIEAVTEFVDQELEALDCPLKAQMQIDVAVDEIFSNIARYAYAPEKGDVTIRLETEQTPLAVNLTFIDRGKPYDPLAKEDPDTTLSADERQIGGLGIFVVKKTMDDMRYEYKDGQNILTLRKNL